MPLGKGQSYRANSFDLGFINITPVDVILQITDIDIATNELKLSLVSAGLYESEKAVVAIVRWFKEIYPSRTKENCMLKNARAFQKLVDLNCASRASVATQDRAIK
jgi:hypothetical protein